MIELNVELEVSGMTQYPTDKSLSIRDMAADAKSTGDAIGEIREKINTDVVTKSEDLIDDLATDDPTKALSAAQGYALNSKIGNHATTINSSKIELNRSANVVTMDIMDGTYTTNYNGVLTAGTSGDEIVLPSGYRPPHTIYLYDGTTNKPIQVRSTGKLVATCSNTAVRVSGSWITNNDMPI